MTYGKISFLQKAFAQENLKQTINDIIKNTARDYAGTPYLCAVGSPKDRTGIDCSGLAARTAEHMPGLREILTIHRTSQDQFTALKAAGILYKTYGCIKELERLDFAQAIFLNEGPTAWQQKLIDDGMEVERRDGINHVVMTFHNEDGHLYVAESSRKEGDTHVMPIKAWLDKKLKDPKIEKIYVVDLPDAVKHLNASSSVPCHDHSASAYEPALS